MSEKPPRVLANARVLEYAVLDESVTYSGHSSLFVGNINEGLKELGPVPCLAIAQDLKTGEIMLLHCDEEWDVLGVVGDTTRPRRRRRAPSAPITEFHAAGWTPRSRMRRR